jgi:phage/plasmid-associated DNA primase
MGFSFGTGANGKSTFMNAATSLHPGRNPAACPCFCDVIDRPS